MRTTGMKLKPEMTRIRGRVNNHPDENREEECESHRQQKCLKWIVTLLQTGHGGGTRR